jgi:hypothetical protein
MTNKFSNHELVTLAVYLLGGESKFIDTEDIAIRANDLAPGRFTWRKYPQQINIENVRTFLSDAKKLKNGGLVNGSGTKGWMLSETGLEFARSRLGDVEGQDLTRVRPSAKEKQWIRNERDRMLSSDAFRKFQEKGIESITHQEAAAFFRIDDYVTSEARERKLLRILNSFRDDVDLAQAIKEIAHKVREG